MRLPRPRIDNCCVHVTHRCQERRYLLGTDIDRKQYVKRLWQASQRFRTVRLLDYVVTSNHIHLLMWVPRIADLSEMMKWLQGTSAGDYNRRVGREGAFWRGRFHPTLVETGSHLSRCLFYLDMNMVRAGVVPHPRQWRFGGYHELNGNRKRYRIIDFNRVLDLLAIPDVTAFRRWYEATLAELCLPEEHPREPHWSQAFAVGSRTWLCQLAGGDSEIEEHIRPLSNTTENDQETT
ncbi:MAG: transposase, partial [Lentisphaeria bacterium]|nr:transposase [Lentisphaeria bacterium]